MQGTPVQSSVREGRPHAPWDIWAHVPQLLGLLSGICELQLLSPRALDLMLHDKRSHSDKRPSRGNLDSGPTHHNWKPAHSNEDSQK